jgi:hypothetical protein
MSMNKSIGEQQVLSPWADADPVPARGITERLDDLNGKKNRVVLQRETSGLSDVTSNRKVDEQAFPEDRDQLVSCVRRKCPRIREQREREV